MKVRNIHKRFGAFTALNDVSLDIAAGELVCLLGPSGCGKTTLLRALAGLDTPDAGQIRAPARPSVVFQEHRLLPWATLWENVALGHESTIGR
ncbi:ATP-binding cassette domain-containing protein, partial [Pseudoalteromonas sp. SIMBA_153]